MKDHFHTCLDKCKSLTNNDIISSLSKKELELISADKLIFDYAIEMCQSAALEELFGDLEMVRCFLFHKTLLLQKTKI